MKKLLFTLLFSVLITPTAKPMAKPVNEQEFSKALIERDAGPVIRLLGQGVNSNYVFTQGIYKGDTPLAVLLKYGQKENMTPQDNNNLIGIGNFLITTKGAKKDPQVLNASLQKAVANYNNAIITWLLEMGANSPEIKAQVDTRLAEATKKRDTQAIQKLQAIQLLFKNYMKTAVPPVGSPAPQIVTDAKQLEFINAIADGNIEKVTKFINEPGFNANMIFTITGFRGYTPLSVVMMDKIPVYKIQNNTLQLTGTKDTNPKYKNEILQMLVPKGLDVTQVLGSLQQAIEAKDDIKAFWLLRLSKSILDRTSQMNKGWISQIDKSVAQTKQLSETESVAKKIVWAQINKELAEFAQQLKAKK